MSRWIVGLWLVAAASAGERTLCLSWLSLLSLRSAIGVACRSWPLCQPTGLKTSSNSITHWVWWMRAIDSWWISLFTGISNFRCNNVCCLWWCACDRIRVSCEVAFIEWGCCWGCSNVAQSVKTVNLFPLLSSVSISSPSTPKITHLTLLFLSAMISQLVFPLHPSAIHSLPMNLL